MLAPRVKPGVAFGKSDRSACHWQVAQTVLWHPGFGGGAGGLLLTRQQSPNLASTGQSTGFLPDLTRVKFGSARLPLGGCYRAPPPRRPLPNFQLIGSPQLPLPFAYALGQSDRSTCHWQVAQTVLWHPVFPGGDGDQGRPALIPLPAAPYALLFLAGFDTRQIRQRLPAPCPSPALSGNRTDQPATGRLLRRSSGTRVSRAVRAIKSDRR